MAAIASSPAIASSGDLAAYVRARAADAAGQPQAALAGYAEALAANPGDPAIAARAYREAVAAGDDALATRASAALAKAGEAPPGAVLLDLADAIRAGDGKRQDAALGTIRSAPFGFMAPSLGAWRGSDAHARRYPALTATAGSALTRRYGEENAALLAIAGGDAKGGFSNVQALIAADPSRRGLARDAAALLRSAGHDDFARELTGADGILPPPAKPSFAFGASRMFVRLAEDLSAGDPTPFTIVLLRAALRIDPAQDFARLILARELARQDDGALALAALDQVPADSPWRDDVRALRVAILGASGNDAGALSAAKALAASDDATGDDIARYADLLSADGQNVEAAKAYGRAIAKAGAAADWTLYLRQGGAYDQAGDWAAARPLLVHAVALVPQEPVALNYLGYGDLVHGGDVAAATAMLAKARALKPGDAAITDSLGWALMRGGQPARALPLLQSAAQDSPGDAEVHDHLGDALWALGRRWEARYAWRAALIPAEGAEARRIAAKLASGPAPAR